MALHLLLPDKVCLIPGQHLGIAGIHAHQHHRVLRPAVYLYLGHTLYRAQAVFQQIRLPQRHTGAAQVHPQPPAALMANNTFHTFGSPP